jgi:large subunit ribosomal protein L23
MNIYEVIKRPLITEGSTLLASEHNQFTFEVDVRANKIEIKQAVERFYEVDVVNITTMIMPKKRGTRGRKMYVRSPEYKKAIVTLPEGQKIADFNV